MTGCPHVRAHSAALDVSRSHRGTSLQEVNDDLVCNSNDLVLLDLVVRDQGNRVIRQKGQSFCRFSI